MIVVDIGNLVILVWVTWKIYMSHCETCGQPIGNDPHMSHRYFGKIHNRCLDQTIEITKQEVVEIDKELEN